MENKEIRFQIKNETSGIVFNVRILEPGQVYGRNHALENDSGRNLIEFYDSRYEFDRDTQDNVLGQFVSRYYMETMIDRSKTFANHGLSLDGGVPNWTIDAKGMEDLFNKLEYFRYKEDPNLIQDTNEKVDVTFYEWHYTKSGDKDFSIREISVPKYKLFEITDELKSDNNISDVFYPKNQTDEISLKM